MRTRLRWKIMAFTVLPLVTLAFATLWTVNRSITQNVHQGIHADLKRASAVLDMLLGSRAQSLAVASRMTVQDPKFFSVLAIPGSFRDPQLRATVAGVARDFNAITQADLFEVTDPAGHLIASVGRDASVARGREAFVSSALATGPASIILAQPRAHYQVFVTPVFAGGRRIGALVLGARIDAALAEQLRQLTRSDVTFVSGSAVTGSTLDTPDDREAVLAAVNGLTEHRGAGLPPSTILEVNGHPHQYLTLISALPRSRPDQKQFYVMQRSFDTETAFLRNTQTDLLGLGIAAVLVALLAGFLVAERITAPVQRLVRGAEEMERGNYDFPLGITARDEIGELATRFDDMRRQQREFVRGLREAAQSRKAFIAIASHELRTPITVIRGFHELMAGGTLGELRREQRIALEGIERSVATLMRIADDATQLSQIDGDRLVLEKSDCDVTALVHDTLEEARQRAKGRSVALVSDVGPAVGRVRADVDRLSLALLNLVTNGIRFTPDGGRVEVSASRSNDGLLLEVRDTGIGIDPERCSQLFEHTARARPSMHHHSSSWLEFNSAGLGLGLQIAHGIVEAHGGRIAAESTPGAGSRFTLWIPLNEVPANAEAA